MATPLTAKGICRNGLIPAPQRAQVPDTKHRLTSTTLTAKKICRNGLLCAPKASGRQAQREQSGRPTGSGQRQQARAVAGARLCTAPNWAGVSGTSDTA